MKKKKKHIKGWNTYRAASAVIVTLSVVIFCLVLRNENEAVSQEIQQEKEVILFQVETEPTEESEITSVLMQAATSESIEEQEAIPEETVKSTPNPESTVSLEATPEPIQEQTPEPTREPVKEPMPEETSKPTKEPILEATPEPTLQPLPEMTPVPTPLLTPEPETHSHSWLFSEWFQEPTCSNGGLATEVCAQCGETQVTTGTPTGEHSFHVETAGDCCSEEILVCNECNYRQTGDKDLFNHVDEEEGFCYGCGKSAE